MDDDLIIPEVARLKRELARVTEERDILKKAARYFAKESAGSTDLCRRISGNFDSLECAGCSR
jgi:transposase-like protein